MLKRRFSVAICAALCSTGLAACRDGGEPPKQASVESITITPADLARIRDIDPRYQSYNVEMLEVTGGKFWAPYGPQIDAILRHSRPRRERQAGSVPLRNNLQRTTSVCLRPAPPGPSNLHALLLPPRCLR
jgi:hypothetical protein